MKNTEELKNMTRIEDREFWKSFFKKVKSSNEFEKQIFMEEGWNQDYLDIMLDEKNAHVCLRRNSSINIDIEYYVHNDVLYNRIKNKKDYLEQVLDLNFHFRKKKDAIYPKAIVKTISFDNMENQIAQIIEILKKLKKVKEFAKETWIISANYYDYDLERAFNELDDLDWHKAMNVLVGDLVYIYAAGIMKQIRFKTIVIEENVLFDNIIDDIKYQLNNDKFEKDKDKKFFRLHLLEKYDDSRLELQYLLNNGLKTAPQGPCRLSKELLNYIENVTFENNINDSEIQVYGTEGKKRKDIVSSYERNPILREQAIKEHGTKCQICGFDFEKVYGDIGKGYIEVHHINPLASIGTEVVTNPKTDLACVCSNCHRMLHRKKDKVLSIDELKEIYNQHK